MYTNDEYEEAIAWGAEKAKQLSASAARIAELERERDRILGSATRIDDDPSLSSDARSLREALTLALKWVSPGGSNGDLPLSDEISAFEADMTTVQELMKAPVPPSDAREEQWERIGGAVPPWHQPEPASSRASR